MKAETQSRQPLLPRPEIYEAEYRFWPWGRLLKAAAHHVVRLAPPRGVVLDYMCGTGFLLERIRRRRPDLRLSGCSLTRSYIRYGQKRYPKVRLIYRNALKHTPGGGCDVIVCTAGLHHLAPRDQTRFLKKVFQELKPGGWLVLGEEIIRNNRSENGRRESVLELGTALIRYALGKRAPNAVLQAALDVLQNDLLQSGEYKLSLEQLRKQVAATFVVRRVIRTWPITGAPYGDRLLLCQKPQ